jgi:hypothetical protein
MKCNAILFNPRNVVRIGAPKYLQDSAMTLHPLAGKPAPESILENIPRLVSNYYSLTPDATEPGHRVTFGTSGHRGSSNKHTFNEAHILAISQAVCEYRAITGSRALRAHFFLEWIPMRFPNLR